LRSQLPIELVGWHLSRGAAVWKETEIASILALKTKFADFAVRSNDVAAQAYRTQTGEEGISLPDPVAMALLLEPGLVLASSEHYVDVQVDSGITRGMSVVDRLGVVEDGRNRAAWTEVLKLGRKQRVVWTMDIPGFKKALVRALA
jgi:purine nucleosidase